MKAVVASFNQEKALVVVGAFSVIVTLESLRRFVSIALNVRRVLVHQIDVGQWVGAAAAATRHRAGEEEEDC